MTKLVFNSFLRAIEYNFTIGKPYNVDAVRLSSLLEETNTTDENEINEDLKSAIGKVKRNFKGFPTIDSIEKSTSFEELIKNTLSLYGSIEQRCNNVEGDKPNIFLHLNAPFTKDSFKIVRHINTASLLVFAHCEVTAEGNKYFGLSKEDFAKKVYEENKKLFKYKTLQTVYVVTCYGNLFEEFEYEGITFKSAFNNAKELKVVLNYLGFVCIYSEEELTANFLSETKSVKYVFNLDSYESDLNKSQNKKGNGNMEDQKVVVTEEAVVDNEQQSTEQAANNEQAESTVNEESAETSTEQEVNNEEQQPTAEPNTEANEESVETDNEQINAEQTSESVVEEVEDEEKEQTLETEMDRMNNLVETIVSVSNKTFTAESLEKLQKAVDKVTNDVAKRVKVDEALIAAVQSLEEEEAAKLADTEVKQTVWINNFLNAVTAEMDGTDRDVNIKMAVKTIFVYLFTDINSINEAMVLDYVYECSVNGERFDIPVACDFGKELDVFVSAVEEKAEVLNNLEGKELKKELNNIVSSAFKNELLSVFNSLKSDSSLKDVYAAVKTCATEMGKAIELNNKELKNIKHFADFVFTLDRIAADTVNKEIDLLVGIGFPSMFAKEIATVRSLCNSNDKKQNSIVKSASGIADKVVNSCTKVFEAGQKSIGNIFDLIKTKIENGIEACENKADDADDGSVVGFIKATGYRTIGCVLKAVNFVFDIVNSVVTCVFDFFKEIVNCFK